MALPFIPTLAPGAIDRLLNYHWPGNVRELENAVERALILSHREPLTFEDLGTLMQKGSGKKTSGITDNSLLNLDQAITQHILRALETTGGKVGGEEGAAQLLEINPSTLRKKMRKLGIPFGRKARSHS
jgi:DNA-binding NtrC family response regulator